MAYKHGVYTSEVPTSIKPPVTSDAAVPVVFGTAPINMAVNNGSVNKPVLCYSYAEAVEQFGYVPAVNNPDLPPEQQGVFEYTLSEFMSSHFALFAVTPVILINVLDISQHTTQVTDEDTMFVASKAVIEKTGVLKNTVSVKDFEQGEDYDLTFDKQGYIVIHAIEGSPMHGRNENLEVSYTYLDASKVDVSDIIGGIDTNTGKATGYELLNEVFPRTRIVPGQVLAPKFTTDVTVAAVQTAKASNINGMFKAISLVDIPTQEVDRYSDAPAYKNTNNLTSEQQLVCWPMVSLGGVKYHLSTQLAGVICATDAANSDVPYKSPSNENLQANSSVLLDGTEINLGPDVAAYLNGEGILTALNFIGGWKAWGNRTGAYPANSDPKDAFIPIRRMFNWIANSLILSYWDNVDDPLNRRQIDTVVDSNNIWLNGLAGQGFILGGRVEFLADENPLTDLMDGISRFHVYISPPSPNRQIDFILEYDISYLQSLFG